MYSLQAALLLPMVYIPSLDQDQDMMITQTTPLDQAPDSTMMTTFLALALDLTTHLALAPDLTTHQALDLIISIS